MPFYESPFPKNSFAWVEDRILNVSVPFTWLMPSLPERYAFDQESFLYDRIRLGGPAVALLPDFFADTYPDIEMISGPYPGRDPNYVLNKISPEVFRSSVGCPHACSHCGVGRLIEPDFFLLQDWPAGYICCDNNITAAPLDHFERVVRSLIDRDPDNPRADFQGLDARLLTADHVSLLSQIKDLKIRIAFDSPKIQSHFMRAFELLRSGGIAKHKISSYALIGFDQPIMDDWDRCQLIDRLGINCLPQWYHELDALEFNKVTDRQAALGWTDEERLSIMQWFYHRKAHHPSSCRAALYGV